MYLWLLLPLLAAFGRAQKGANMPIESELARLSIIVCARNEAKNLSRLLPLLRRQRAHKVLLVDDDSSDESGKILARAAQNWRYRQKQKLEILALKNKRSAGKKAALAAGVERAASAAWILVCDADCRPASAQWARRMLAQTEENTDFVLGFSPYLDAGGILGGWQRMEALFTLLQYGGMALRGLPYMGVGRNMLYRRSVFMRYDWQKNADLASGDDDLLVNAQAKGSRTSLCLDPETWVHTLPAQTWGQYIRQKRRHFSAAVRYKLKHKILLAAFVQSHVWSWWLLPLALYACPWGALLLWFGRCIIVDTGLYLLAQKSAHRQEAKFILLYDLGIAAYFTIFAFILALQTKQQRKQWK